MNRNGKKLEEWIGYQFQNEGLFRQAMTHSSYVNEHRMDKLQCNERLEFLGDAVLELVTSHFLYQEYPKKPEGEMTKLRASLVCEPTLAICTKDLNLQKYLLLGKGEEATGGRTRKSILSDALEAVIGALYLDGGMDAAKPFILRYILTDIEHKQLFHDSKTILQEVVQADYKKELHYELVDQRGPDHAREFTVEARMDGTVLGVGTGNTKKAAEQEAAYHALIYLRREDAGKIL